MARIDITLELRQFVDTIATRNTYHGNRISKSLMDMIEIEVREDGAGVLAPYWFSVMEQGRGPRKSTKDHELWKKIYAWMRKRNMFKSRTETGRINEAKSLTWYINKYGNEQFRRKVFIDVYTAAREETIETVGQKYLIMAEQLTEEIL